MRRGEELGSKSLSALLVREQHTEDGMRGDRIVAPVFVGNSMSKLSGLARAETRALLIGLKLLDARALIAVSNNTITTW